MNRIIPPMLYPGLFIYHQVIHLLWNVNISTKNLNGNLSNTCWDTPRVSACTVFCSPSYCQSFDLIYLDSCHIKVVMLQVFGLRGALTTRYKTLQREAPSCLSALSTVVSDSLWFRHSAFCYVHLSLPLCLAGETAAINKTPRWSVHPAVKYWSRSSLHHFGVRANMISHHSLFSLSARRVLE